MTAVALDSTLPIFTGLDGKPLSGGAVYIGQPNQDPRTFPAAAYWDAALSIPAAQPLATSAGYVVKAGAPSPVYINNHYSLLVLDAANQQVVYVPDCHGALATFSDYMASVLEMGNAGSARGALGLGTDGTTAFRNRLHNGSFRVNQRNVSGTVTLAANVYGHDRWKAGAGGCTYTFVTSGNVTVITITAGSLMQVIEDKDVEGGIYSLSHQGTAQARIAVNSAATSGAYAPATSANPLLSASANSGQNIAVEFSSGTLDRVQLEPGTKPTAFERRPYGVELALCQRYYETGALKAGATSGTTNATIVFKVPKRTTPTMVYGSSPQGTGTSLPAGADWTSATEVAPFANASTLNFSWTASADL